MEEYPEDFTKEHFAEAVNNQNDIICGKFRERVYKHSLEALANKQNEILIDYIPYETLSLVCVQKLIQELLDKIKGIECMAGGEYIAYKHEYLEPDLELKVILW